jgi:hypothetical protein
MSFSLYGGRGIAMCDEWRNNFTAFKEWAIASGYADDLTIDRIDSCGDYCPTNCRWATRKEQQNNTSYCRMLEYNGETHSIMEWSEILGITHTALYNRMRRGWSIERALTTKKNKYKGD